MRMGRGGHCIIKGLDEMMSPHVHSYRSITHQYRCALSLFHSAHSALFHSVGSLAFLCLIAAVAVLDGRRIYIL